MGQEKGQIVAEFWLSAILFDTLIYLHGWVEELSPESMSHGSDWHLAFDTLPATHISLSDRRLVVSTAEHPSQSAARYRT